VVPETRLGSICSAAGAILLCLVQVPNARGDSASCLAKVSSYVAELDELLAKERNWITPYFDLNDRYFPFRDCDTYALLDEVSRSRFIRPITYHPRTKTYLIVFSSNDVSASFAYVANERKSIFPTAGFVTK
jgi:hypothetical protein